MHKKKQRSEVPKGDYSQKTRWAKYLLVPAALGAVLLTAKYSRKGDEDDSGQACTKQLENENLLKTPCCTVLVTLPSSEIYKKVSNGNDSLGISNMTYEEDGSTHGFSVVLHPSSKLYSRSTIDLLEGFSAPIREDILRSARIGTFQYRDGLTQLIAGAKDPVDPESTVGIVYKNLKETNKGYEIIFLERATRISMLQKGLAIKAGGPNASLRNVFINTVVQEATHGAQIRYCKEKGLGDVRHLMEETTSELFGYLAAIAYGENPFEGMKHIIDKCLTYYIYQPFLHHTVEITPHLSAKKQLLFHTLFMRMVNELGIMDPLEILDSADAELRSAAARALDEESKRVFGKPFGDVVPLEDLEKMKQLSRAYFDKWYSQT